MERSARFEVARLYGASGGGRRLLLLGDAAAVAPDGDGSLPAALLERAPDVDVDVLWDLAPAVRAIAGASSSWRLWRYDAVVVVLDEQAVQQARGSRLRRLRQAAGDLAAAGALIVVLTSTEAGGPDAERAGASLLQHLRTSERGAARLTAEWDAGSLADPRDVADRVLAAVPDGRPAGAAPPQDAQARQAAVDRARAATGGASPGLERVVLLARNSFEVPYAQVNLVDRGRLRTLAFTGRAGDDVEDPLCALALERRGPVLVADTREDRRFDANPNVHGPRAVRFYGAHPIESLDGHPIGVVCVFDFVPHPVEAGDGALLRDLAVLAEAEINALTAGPGG